MVFIGAKMCRFTFVFSQEASTFGAMADKLNRSCRWWTFFEVHTDNFRDNLASFFYINKITQANIQVLDDIGVVQTCPFYYCSSKLDGT